MNAALNAQCGVLAIAGRLTTPASKRANNWRGVAMQQRTGAPRAGGESRWLCASLHNCEAI